MEWIKKITDIIMPWPEEEEEEISEVQKKPELKAIETTPEQQVQNFVAAETPLKRVAAGGGATVGFAAAPVVGNVGIPESMPVSSNENVSFGGGHIGESSRPNLSVLKTPELAVNIYTPRDFNQVAGIADDLLSKRAAVVNFEYVKGEEQQRICDFVNGVCYVIDGSADLISEKIILYVPDGVDAQDIVKSVSSDAPAFLKRNF